MTAEALDLTITASGVYPDLPNDVYHADPTPHGSLSYSGAKKLLDPYCPAVYRWERDHPEQSKLFDFANAAHKLVLGDFNSEIRIIEADSYRTKRAQEERDEARANRIAPVLRHQYEQVLEMAAEIRAHPIASKLFDPDRGQPEQSLFWTDKETGITCRCRVDWMPDRRWGRMILPDYKTCESAHREKFRKTAANYGYHQQDAWYTAGAKAVGLDDEPVFVFVAQEREPPYLVNVIQLTDASVNIGRNLNRHARRLYAECVANDYWPGYGWTPTGYEVELVDLPAWYLRDHDEEPET